MIKMNIADTRIHCIHMTNTNYQHFTIEFQDLICHIDDLIWQIDLCPQDTIHCTACKCNIPEGFSWDEEEFELYMYLL